MPIPIIIAFGVEFRDRSHVTGVRDWLNTNATVAGADRWRYARGRRSFEIRITFAKADFIAALNVRDAFVIYDGHARYGQGPAFTTTANVRPCSPPAAMPVNPFGDHVRMGFDAVSVPCGEEIFGHCTNPAEYPEVPPRGAFLERSVRRMIARAAAARPGCAVSHARRSLNSCVPAVAATRNERGEQSLLTRHYYSQHAYVRPPAPVGWPTPQFDFDTLVTVGAADLDASTLACSVLFLNSCSSAPHFLEPLRRKKRAVRSGCVFYLTWREAYPAASRATLTFLQNALLRLDPTSRRGAASLNRRMNGNTRGSRVLAGHIDFFS
ncbi:MAG: hypothetical protein JWO97_3855 [Acidobacteria bacterium]|nr:hypothetical protein [Acidobacteriota bacterium]